MFILLMMGAAKSETFESFHYFKQGCTVFDQIIENCRAISIKGPLKILYKNRKV